MHCGLQARRLAKQIPSKVAIITARKGRSIGLISPLEEGALKPKFLASVVAAGLLLLALAPGTAFAVNPSNLDQENLQDNSNITDYTGNGGDVTVAQTFTAGRT